MEDALEPDATTLPCVVAPIPKKLGRAMCSIRDALAVLAGASEATLAAAEARAVAL